MRSFAENAKVLEVCKSAALSKAFIPKGYKHRGVCERTFMICSLITPPQMQHPLS